MGFDVTGGHLVAIALIVMIGLGMMWNEYLNTTNVPESVDSDYGACIYSCRSYSNNYSKKQCQIRCEPLSLCEDSDKT